MAQTSCVAPPLLKDELSAAPVVFVGMVVSTSNSGRRARARVESFFGENWQEFAINGIVVVVTSAAVAVWRRRVLTDTRRRASPGK